MDVPKCIWSRINLDVLQDFAWKNNVKIQLSCPFMAAGGGVMQLLSNFHYRIVLYELYFTEHALLHNLLEMVGVTYITCTCTYG